jgi:hypothetical protein
VRTVLLVGFPAKDGQETLPFLSPCDEAAYSTLASEKKPEKLLRATPHCHRQTLFMNNYRMALG